MPKARRGDVSQRVRLIMEHHFGETNCPAGEKYHKRVGPRCWFIWKYDAPDAIRSFGEINPARTFTATDTRSPNLGLEAERQSVVKEKSGYVRVILRSGRIN